MRTRTIAGVAASVALALAFQVGGAVIRPAAAESVSDFYKGKQITIVIGSGAGGGYDAYARLVARHLGDHVPGKPAIVPQNKPGAGSLTMVNALVNSGPFDGTAIGASQSSAPVEKLLHLGSEGGKAAHFDATKIHWLGSASQDVFVLFDWHTSKVKSFDDLKKTEMLLGSSGPNTDGSLIATALNKILGTKIKLITGYQTSTAEMHAMEQGEIDGNAMAYASVVVMHSDWIKDGKIRFLAQMANERQPGLDDVPFVLDLVKNKEERAVLELIFAKYRMGRPFFVAPKVPADRVAALRAAFDATMKDPMLLAEAKKQRLEVRPVSGADVQAMIAKLYKTPEPLVQRARDALGTK
ncbi:MAG TPA: tripartite tricarboxylate transporter substrate-binding protein [Alphaproteobacteria bacterium]|nr:tripartite tricarboxylate transporter substrate-binding protein [Alphaproteobacteria bacterium]